MIISWPSRERSSCVRPHRLREKRPTGAPPRYLRAIASRRTAQEPNGFALGIWATDIGWMRNSDRGAYVATRERGCGGPPVDDGLATENSHRQADGKLSVRADPFARRPVADMGG